MATWEGSPIRTDKFKKFYGEVRVSPKLSFVVGDIVLIKAPEKCPPYIARVESLWEGKKKRERGTKYMNLRWFYRAADCIGVESGQGFDSFESEIARSAWVALPDGSRSVSNEVFWTNHVDANTLESLIGKAQICYSAGAGKKVETWGASRDVADYICRYQYVIKTKSKNINGKISFHPLSSKVTGGAANRTVGSKRKRAAEKLPSSASKVALKAPDSTVSLRLFDMVNSMLADIRGFTRGKENGTAHAAEREVSRIKTFWEMYTASGDRRHIKGIEASVRHLNTLRSTASLSPQYVGDSRKVRIVCKTSNPLVEKSINMVMDPDGEVRFDKASPKSRSGGGKNGSNFVPCDYCGVHYHNKGVCAHMRHCPMKPSKKRKTSQESATSQASRSNRAAPQAGSRPHIPVAVYDPQKGKRPMAGKYAVNTTLPHSISLDTLDIHLPGMLHRNAKTSAASNDGTVSSSEDEVWFQGNYENSIKIGPSYQVEVAPELKPAIVHVHPNLDPQAAKELNPPFHPPKNGSYDNMPFTWQGRRFSFGLNKARAMFRDSLDYYPGQFVIAEMPRRRAGRIHTQNVICRVVGRGLQNTVRAMPWGSNVPGFYSEVLCERSRIKHIYSEEKLIEDFLSASSPSPSNRLNSTTELRPEQERTLFFTLVRNIKNPGERYPSELSSILSSWTNGEHGMFSHLFGVHGKNFSAIADRMAYRTLKEVICYYYAMKRYQSWVPISEGTACVFCLQCGRQSRELEFFKCASTWCDKIVCKLCHGSSRGTRSGSLRKNKKWFWCCNSCCEIDESKARVLSGIQEEEADDYREDSKHQGNDEYSPKSVDKFDQASTSNAFHSRGLDRGVAALVASQPMMHNRPMAEVYPDVYNQDAACRFPLNGTQPQVVIASTKTPPSAQATNNAAQNFLDALWKTFKDTSPLTYHMFEGLLQKYQDGKVDAPGLVRGGVTLLRDHWLLLNMFASFIPYNLSPLFHQELARWGVRVVASPHIPYR